jgi:hypothetical protein
MTLVSTGCVDRLIRDFGEVADGGRDEFDIDTDTDPGETEQLPDPDAECSIPQDCGMNQTCYEGVCVGTGSVRVSLSWNVVTDLDLHLRVPTGEWLSYEMPLTSYGELDVDDCVAGMCVNQDGTHVENIFLDGSAPRGTYGVMIVNFDGRRAADYGIEVAGDVTASFVGHLPSSEFYEGSVHEFTW